MHALAPATPAGRGKQTEVLGGVTTTDVYGYDAAGRVETVTRNGTLAVTYDYDANGNRNAVTTAGGTVSATFDAQDRILTFGARTYTHTPHGDVAGWTDSATSTTTTLTYDVQGNLRQVQQPGTTITYTVDGRNRRIGKALNGTLVQGFLWQGQLRPVAELDGAGNLVSRFVYGTRINVPEYLVKGGVTYRLVTDHLTGLTPPGRPEHQFADTGVNLLETYTPPTTVPAAGPADYSYDTARRPRVVTRADGQSLIRPTQRPSGVSAAPPRSGTPPCRRRSCRPRPSTESRPRPRS